MDYVLFSGAMFLVNVFLGFFVNHHFLLLALYFMFAIATND